MGAHKDNVRESKRMKENILISLKNIVVEFDGQRILKGINLDIHDEEFVTFLGPSGCGKTTTLRMISGFEYPTSGSVFIGERDVAKIPPNKRGISMVFQSYALFPHLNIWENVAYGLRVNGVKDENLITEKVELALRRAALWNEVEDRLSSSALGLSGGQQQRLCIARALAVEPQVLLMDEPASALDPIATRKVEESIVELKEGLTIIIVTHSMQQAARISDRTAFFYMGRLVESDSTDVIFTRPSQKETEDYITGRFG